VPAKLHLARNADDTDPAAFTDRHVIWFKCLRLLPA
jgi:NADH:ubiquinone oxidoreductase subunit F (NADH-binding)